MISEKLATALNEQVNAELYSAYLYLSMASYFESLSLKGFAHWMHIQAREEQDHALKLYHYINERGGRANFNAIAAPPENWDSPLEVFEQVYQHEQVVTGLIHALVDLAFAEKDHAMYHFLQWYVAEQVEEEATADEIVQQVRMAGDSAAAILMLDRELGQRAK